MTTAPPQYISHQTGKPNKNRSYYFTCPISTEYELGVKHGKEMYKGYQDWKKHIRNAVAQAIMTKGLSGEDAKVKETEALNLLEEARKEEKNKEIINPEYEEWLKSKPTKTTKSKTSVSDLAIENENLKKELEDREKQFNDDFEELKSRIERRDETINELNAIIEELKKSQKQPRKKKEQGCLGTD